MKLTTIVLSSVLTLGSTLALAQGASSGDAAAAGGATGGPAGAGSSSAIKGDKLDPAARGTARKAPVRATRRPLQPVARLADRLGLDLPVQLRATPQAPHPRPAKGAIRSYAPRALGSPQGKATRRADAEFSFSGRRPSRVERGSYR